MTKMKVYLKIMGVILITIFVGLFSCDETGVTNPYNATLVFEQIDYNFVGFEGTNTSWGMVTLTYEGSSTVLYFNLVVNGTWVIQNIPVLSIYGVNEEQSYTFSFDLGIDQGTDITQLSYAFDLTTNLLDTMPTQNSTATVNDGSYVLYSGFSDPGDFHVTFTPQDSYLHTVNDVVNSAKLPEADKLPNPQTDMHECCPMAVSNSLHYLNDTKDTIDLDDDDMSVDEMKNATGWTEGSGCGDDWWTIKGYWFAGLISVQYITDIDSVFPEIEPRGQDVEMVVKYAIVDRSGDEDELLRDADGNPIILEHCVNIIGISKHSDGAYTIVFKHDRDQSQEDPSDLKEETIRFFYNNAEDHYEGWLRIGEVVIEGVKRDIWQYWRFEYFVVECPEEN